MFPLITGSSTPDADGRAAVRLDDEARVLVSAFGRAPRHFEFAPVEGKAEQLVALALHDTDEVVIAQLVVPEVEGERVRLVEKARMGNAGRPGVVMWARPLKA